MDRTAHRLLRADQQTYELVEVFSHVVVKVENLKVRIAKVFQHQNNEATHGLAVEIFDGCEYKTHTFVPFGGDK